MKKKIFKKFKLTKRRIIVLCVLALILFLIIFGLVKLGIKLFSKEVSVGNLSNNGLVVEYNGYTYYNKYDTGIYKYKKGEDEVKLTSDTPSSLVVYNEELYYLTLNGSNLYLRKINLASGSTEEIKMMDTDIEKFYIVNDILYYVSNKDERGIGRFPLNNVEEEKVVINGNVQDFVISKNKIYYTNFDGNLYCVDLAGENQKLIAEGNINKIQILNKYIYFYDSVENALCKIKTNGKGRKVVATFVNNDCFNVTNKSIYYFESKNKQIFRSKLNGKTSVAIVTLDTDLTKINFAANAVYYLAFSKSEENTYQIFRVTKNGDVLPTIDY